MSSTICPKCKTESPPDTLDCSCGYRLRALRLNDFTTDLEKNAFVSQALEGFKAVISLAQTALKVPILINGGAAIAILALVSNTWSESSLTNDLAKSLLFFSLGVLMAAIGTGVSYLTQYSFLHNDENTRGHICRYLTITCVIISYILFMLGSCWSYSAFTTLPGGSCECKS